MGYRNSFIRVAEDCPATRGVVPPGEENSPSIALIQYRLLSAHPYGRTHDELHFDVHVRRKAISEADLTACGALMREQVLGSPHPCLRASPLAKRYGWGFHYDAEGRIALYAMDSAEYQSFIGPGGGVTLIAAMRNRRGPRPAEGR